MGPSRSCWNVTTGALQLDVAWRKKYELEPSSRIETQNIENQNTTDFNTTEPMLTQNKDIINVELIEKILTEKTTLQSLEAKIGKKGRQKPKR